MIGGNTHHKPQQGQQTKKASAKARHEDALRKFASSVKPLDYNYSHQGVRMLREYLLYNKEHSGKIVAKNAQGVEIAVDRSGIFFVVQKEHHKRGDQYFENGFATAREIDVPEQVLARWIAAARKSPQTKFIYHALIAAHLARKFTRKAVAA